jgi:hypothetical protein
MFREHEYICHGKALYEILKGFSMHTLMLPALCVWNGRVYLLHVECSS